MNIFLLKQIKDNQSVKQIEVRDVCYRFSTDRGYMSSSFVCGAPKFEGTCVFGEVPKEFDRPRD